MLTASFPKDARTWVAKAKDHLEDSPANIDVWAIAIHDPKNECQVDIFSKESAADKHPSATATVGEGYALTGGGAQANWKGEGSLLTASYPEGSRHWVAASKDHAKVEIATITAYAIGIRAADNASSPLKKIFEMKMFETRTFTNTGASAKHPSAEIFTGPDYVLVGGGAQVNWQGEGNLLTASYPDRNTWKVASKDHKPPGESCTITAYAIGARVRSGATG